MKEIPLTNRAFSVLVDDEDYEWLSSFPWRAHSSDGLKDCAAITGQGAGNLVRIHRLVMQPSEDQEVDHREMESGITIRDRTCECAIDLRTLATIMADGGSLRTSE